MQSSCHPPSAIAPSQVSGSTSPQCTGVSMRLRFVVTSLLLIPASVLARNGSQLIADTLGPDWTRLFALDTASSMDFGEAVAFDAEGNTYVLGSGNTSTTFSAKP